MEKFTLTVMMMGYVLWTAGEKSEQFQAAECLVIFIYTIIYVCIFVYEMQNINI